MTERPRGSLLPAWAKPRRVVTWYIMVVCCCYIVFIILFSEKFEKAFHQAQILGFCSVFSCLYIAENIVTFSLKQMMVLLLVNKAD